MWARPRQILSLPLSVLLKNEGREGNGNDLRQGLGSKSYLASTIQIATYVFKQVVH